MGDESMSVALISLFGIALTALSGLAGSWITSRGAKEKSVSEQYKALVDDIQEWTETRLAERDERIEELREETAVLRTAVARLEGDVRSWKGRYRVAVEHIEALRPLVPSSRRPPVPEQLRGDVAGVEK
ncbi:hypothetical protein MHT86_05170 [Corynebacterium mastitidis]|nr:hypothetical protein [Corynebacterium mastitidis]MCH6196890.1 hypothetical protein [Corynebacterium mastitidis]